MRWFVSWFSRPAVDKPVSKKGFNGYSLRDPMNCLDEKTRTNFYDGGGRIAGRYTSRRL